MASVSLRTLFVSLVVGIAVCVAGCQVSHYELELKPDGKAVNRKLTAWREKGDELESLPEDELRRIAEAYGTKPPGPAAGKLSFEKSFAGMLPDDVGGKGWYLHWDSPLGSASAYSERFRGNDDLAADVDARQKAVGEIVDFFLGWADAELKDAEDYAALRRLIDVEIRRDLANLSLYWWAYTGIDRGFDRGDAGPKNPNDALMRMGLYLAERDYFDPQQMPALVRAAQEAGDGRPQRLLKIVQRSLATKLGVPRDEPVPDWLKFLAEPERLLASIDRYARTTPRYEAMTERWRREAQQDPDRRPPQPHEVLWEMLAKAYRPDALFDVGDRLRVRLALPVEPFATNAEWDAKASAVVWSRSISARDAASPSGGPLPSRPVVLFAVWSEPRIMVQESYFGRVVIEGEELADYCLWYAALTADERRQWDAFLQTLAGRDDIDERLRRFRFTGEPPFDTAPDDKGRAKRAIELLRGGLRDGER